jgi:hypothetical protein
MHGILLLYERATFTTMLCMKLGCLFQVSPLYAALTASKYIAELAMMSVLAQGLGLNTKECDNLYESDNPIYRSEEEAISVISGTTQVGTCAKGLWLTYMGHV